LAAKENHISMNQPKYELKASKNLLTYIFISNGKNGLIPKMIKFQKTELNGVYNLALGDLNHITGEMNDLVTSNNGDSEKVLFTVASAVTCFTEEYPNAFIYITGSTESRTRFFRIGISKYFIQICNEYDVLGEIENGWESFEPNKSYRGFLVRRISTNLNLF